MLFNRFTRNLKIQYSLFLLVPVSLIILYETNILAVGIYADNPRLQYIWETAAILSVMVCVPVALKLFSVVLKKKIDNVNLSEALNKYIFWSGIRLSILEIAVVLNVIVYYFTLSNVGSFCGLIALTASFFCLPGEKRLREELNVTDEE